MSGAAAASDPFVPFGPGTLANAKSAGGSLNHLKVVPKDDAGSSFSAFQPAVGAAATHAHSAAASGNAPPTITLQKDGDKITGIRVECACGQVIELECSY